MNEPIISSLLDLDSYKLTMLRVISELHFDTEVTFSFINRHESRRILDLVPIEEIQEQLDHVRTLSFSKDELDFLESIPYFPREFVHGLNDIQLPEIKAEAKGDLSISIRGSWGDSTLWETLILSIVNELYFRGLIRHDKENQGTLKERAYSKLRDKLRTLRQYPDLRFSDFGTRRRFSKDWQSFVIETIIEEIPRQFNGTSNLLFAKNFGIKPIGTMAHELFLGYAGFGSSDEDLRDSHNKVFRDWEKIYGQDSSIALTDTYGTEFFFDDFTHGQAERWAGLRQDSGNPFRFGVRALRFYKEHGIDPKTKTIVFSDGLDLRTMIDLHVNFQPFIKQAYGWGTSLTNDFYGKPLSIIVKLVSSNGKPVAKLSDNIAKATGDSETIEHFKRVFHYDSEHYEACRY